MTSTIHVNGHVLMIQPSFLAVVGRRLLVPRDWSKMFVFPRCAIDQSRTDVEEVVPSVVKTTLICFLETQHALSDSEGSMHTDLPFFSGIRRLKEPTHTSDHSLGTPPGLHKGWGPMAMARLY